MVRLSLVLALVLPLLHDASGPAHGLRVKGQAGGITVVLTLPQRVYPQNALIRATVTITNGTDHAVWPSRPCPPGLLPRLEVLSPTGSVLYPPLFAISAPLSCPPLPPNTSGWPDRIDPGRSFSLPVFAVARAGTVRAVAAVIWLAPDGSLGSQEVTTPTATVRLVPGTPPRLSLHDPGHGVTSVTVQPAVPVHGRLFYQEESVCKGEASIGFQETFDWTPADGRTVDLPCVHLVEWHLVAAWVGEPVVSVDYQKETLPPGFPGSPLLHGSR